MAIERHENKNGSVSFRARVRDPNAKFYRSEWRANHDEALADEAEFLGRKRRGERVPDETEGQRYTADDFWAVYQIENRTDVSDGWKMSQDQMWRDYVSPVIGRKRLASVGIPDVGRVLTRMKEMGRGEQMRLHVYRLMLQVFECAVKYYGMLKVNPVVAEHHSVKVSGVERRFLRPEQAWSLLEASREHPAVWVELLAGLRTEATAGLMWEAVHWDVNQVLISWTWKAKVRRLEPLPKGKRAEYVPMAPVLKEYLWERFQRRADTGPRDFVCPGPNGGMLKPETYGPQLKRLCRLAGVPVMTPHELRHSCTEMFVRVGATQEDIRRLLNHKSGATTLRYIHRTDDRLTAIAAKLERPRLQVLPGGDGCTHESTHVGTNQRMPVTG